MRNIAVFIVIVLPFLAGCIWLQIFLSKRQNKWLGLIIPLICFMFSIITVLSLSTFTNIVTNSVAEIEINNGAVITDENITSQLARPGIISMLATVLPVFLISNIPTIIFLAIYFACREKLKLRTELDKMNIQDLE